MHRQTGLVDDYPLFVYGTLLRGQPNHHLFEGRAERIDSGWVEGVELYSLGAFMMMVEGQGRVYGELVCLRSNAGVYAATLADLDRLEMVDGTEGLYQRVVWTVHLVSGEDVLAWVYLGSWEWVIDRLRIESGDWILYLADR